MSKATNAHKIQKALDLIDLAADTLMDVDTPYYKVEVSIQDEYNSDVVIDLTLERVLDLFTNKLSEMLKADEVKALETWKNHARRI